ncbi:MAG: FAD-binding oxidoreductase, partial [Anaerolineales bacterium]|nr:FAD-binding oxidoreductase [Anaerolineales bacterium]
MSEIPDRAQVVVVGAGIVGNSLVYHLADMGWKDVVLLDKGPLPNPGGSTGHASNFIFPVDHSKEMTALTVESIKTFNDLGMFTEPGGIELARTDERMQELTRRLTSAKSWGVPAELITPEQVKEKVPFVNTDLIKGGFWCPTAGVVDPLRAGTLMREHAQKAGSLRSVHANVEITGIEVQAGRARGMHTNQGYIGAEYVVIACGVWSPRLAAMAGARIPLTPMVHQFVTVGPITIFENTRGEIDFPVVRDVDVNMYERQNGSDLEIGSYSHRPIHYPPDDIPSNEEAS